MIYIYFYIYAFSRRFYPKQLTLHSGYTFLSVCVTHPRAILGVQYMTSLIIYIKKCPGSSKFIMTVNSGWDFDIFEKIIKSTPHGSGRLKGYSTPKWKFCH